MIALTLTQPWASLVSIGAKKVETRSWRTGYRGPLAIHAAKGWTADDRALLWEPDFRRALEPTGLVDYRVPHLHLPLGAIVATAHLVSCVRTEDDTVEATELAFGNYSPGRWAWSLIRVHALPEPIPCKGALGLWAVPAEIAARVGGT